MTLGRLRLKTEWIIEEIRREAIDKAFADFQEADRHYYRTSDGGATVTKLIHELEDLGANMEIVFQTDLDIRDEIWPAQ